MRGAIYALSLGLYGRSHVIAEFPRRPAHRGIGLSDWDGYASRLRRVMAYRNTHFDRRPKLDVTNVPAREHGRYDFVVSIDVFEHIAPPVARAFHGAASLLKPHGVFVFSVPYTLDAHTVEHYPALHDYRIVNVRGVRRLMNTRADGRFEFFDDLVFHGGGEATLEMRLFCKADLDRLLQDAGFTEVRVVNEVAEFGIEYDNPCSHTF